MATVAIDGSVVTHTLPTYFAGLGAGGPNGGDFSVAAYQASLANINPEVLRWNPWRPDCGTVASPLISAAMPAMRDLGVAMGTNMAVSLAAGVASPNGVPNTAAAPNSTNSLPPSTAGNSPKGLADWWLSYMQAGVNVKWFEPFNEPANSGAGKGNALGPWFSTDTNGLQAETWAQVNYRQYRAEVIARQAANSSYALPRMTGGTIADTHPYAQGWSKTWMGATCLDHSSWPWAAGDLNLNYTDTYAFHSYGAGSTTQAQINSVTWNPGSFSTLNDDVATKSVLSNLRTYMDGLGYSGVKLTWNESGFDNVSALGGIFDVVSGILGFSHQALYKIDYFAQWSYNPSNAVTGGGVWPVMDASGSFVVNTRGRFLRDLVFYFSRNYKKQLISGTTGVTGSGLTPQGGENSGLNNSVPRINVSAGLNAAGDKIAILVANGDLTTAETVTINLNNVTINGNVTGRKGLQTETGTGATTLPSITPITPVAGSFSKNIEAGAAYLFEVPIVSGGGSGNPTATGDYVDPSPNLLRVNAVRGAGTRVNNPAGRVSGNGGGL